MQSEMKKRRRGSRLKLPQMSKEAARVLKVGLPFIAAALIALTLKMQNELPEHPVTVIQTYPGMYEYIFAALTLLILGAMIFDAASKSK